MRCRDIAALVAVPLPRSNQRLIITPMGPTEEPPLPMAKMMPYSRMTCHCVWASPISPMPAEAITTAIAITLRTLKLSTSLPTNGMETAPTIMKQVAASESEERLSSRSSLIGLSSKPKAKRDPAAEEQHCEAGRQNDPGVVDAAQDSPLHKDGRVECGKATSAAPFCPS